MRARRRGQKTVVKKKAKASPSQVKKTSGAAVAPTQLIGPRKLTRFERARVVGARALQISMGAPVLIEVDERTVSPIDIAELELEGKVLPISIRRSLPDGTSQNIPLKLLLNGEP